MATYDERRAARQDRLDSRRDRLNSEAADLFQAARDKVAGIPFGQPILVGHHSERRHRSDLAQHDSKMRAGIEASKAADAVPDRATTAILASDDDATTQLRQKIAETELAQDRMKKANALIRKGDRDGLAELAFTPTQIAGLFKPDFMGRIGFPGWALSNNNANIARMRARLAHLEKEKNSAPVEEELANGVRMEEDPEAMRLRLIFPGKPDRETIADLKSSGFRWAPSSMAWQRQLNNAARWAAQEVMRRIAQRAEPVA